MDPNQLNIIVFDHLLRIASAEVLKAVIWAAVFSLAYLALSGRR